MTIVAIVDSGLNLKHRDISPNLWVNSGEIPNNGIDDDLLKIISNKINGIVEE